MRQSGAGRLVSACSGMSTIGNERPTTARRRNETLHSVTATAVLFMPTLGRDASSDGAHAFCRWLQAGTSRTSRPRPEDWHFRALNVALNPLQLSLISPLTNKTERPNALHQFLAPAGICQRKHPTS